MANLTVDDLTTTKLDGTGVFDHLMRAVGAHIHQEYLKNRIKGPEYSTVYLAALQSCMEQSIQFLLEKDKVKLLEKQIEVANQQIAKEQKGIELLIAQIAKANQEEALLAQKVKTEKAQINAADVVPNSVIGKQNALYDAQTKGYQRDAELKVAKAMIETWVVRNTAGTATNPDAINKLDDTHIGSAVSKMLTGIEASPP